MHMYGSGLMVEPLVEIEAEFSLHGALGKGTGWSMHGAPTRLFHDARGAWAGNEPTQPGDLAAKESDVLEETFEKVQAALTRAGYFGPFGIDAFRWRDPAGATHFQPLSEINARYSMGFFVGIVARQREMFEQLAAESREA